jgi:hypothetical protein
MKNERTLSFQMSKAISKEELENVSGSVSQTNSWTANGSYDPRSGWDGCLDVTIDM